MRATFVLGLDIGSSTTKAALVEVTEEVSVVHVARRRTPSDADDLITAAADVMRECAAAASGPIAAIGIAAMAESGAALDAGGNALTPLLRWDRGVDRSHVHTLLTQHPGLPAATGIPATTKPAAVALLALRAERPDVFGAMRHWSGVADIVAHALTGERATDHTLAARTMLADFGGESWNSGVIESLGARTSLLPELRAPGEPVGATSAAARRFGLARGIPVHIAGHDHAVGAWATAVRRPGETADSLGTAEAIVRVTDAVDIARAVDAGFSIGRTVDGTGVTILGGSPTCGAMLAWWDAEHPEDRMLSQLTVLPTHEWKDGAAIVLPYPSGRQCPAPDPDARVRVLGDTRSPVDRAHSLLQSLVAHARWIRETADDLAGSPTSSLSVVGSLTERIPAWAPLIAAAGVPTSVCAEQEPVAAGAALLAAVRAGEARSDAPVLECTKVTPSHGAGFEDTYRRFLAAVTAEGES
ncbi:FGGY family carbohydrate kinase [Microbacterium sp.]|uniref:FGGY family carbohydrate kinase n=1 Tax=Microbacterium sp. TaxID=51671 RepID=UPI0027375B29|nr:FGGY family carbohydrate kinase [Microbacterium sp.]MDP3952667.1 FGGY family carbohydrate kinase [Microbacterium sp.]